MRSKKRQFKVWGCKLSLPASLCARSHATGALTANSSAAYKDEVMYSYNQNK